MICKINHYFLHDIRLCRYIFNLDKLFVASVFDLSTTRVYFPKLPLVVIETRVDNYLP